MPDSPPSSRPALVTASAAFLVSTVLVGLPLFWGSYVIVIGLLEAIDLGWIVGSAVGIAPLLATFLYGLWIAGVVAGRLLETDSVRGIVA